MTTNGYQVSLWGDENVLMKIKTMALTRMRCKEISGALITLSFLTWMLVTLGDVHFEKSYDMVLFCFMHFSVYVTFQ